MPAGLRPQARRPVALAQGTRRKVIGLAGIACLGGALAYAPIAALADDIGTVSNVGLAGLALILVARCLPGPPATRRDAERAPSPIDDR